MIELNRHLGGKVSLDPKSVSGFREEDMDDSEVYCVISMKDGSEYEVAYSYDELRNILKTPGQVRVISG